MLASDTATRSGPAEQATRSVLVASRAASVRETLVGLVKAHDPSATIEVTASGQDLLAAFRRRTPDLAFVDLHLDGMSGPEAVAVAKAAGIQASDLILMSARIHEGWVEVCQQLDAYEFLRTPLDGDHIARLMRESAMRFRPIQSLLVASAKQERQFVLRALTRSQFTFKIEESDSSAYACKQLQLASFDIAFVDFDLAGRDGLEAACQIRNVSPETRLVLMAGGDAAHLVDAARHCGIPLILQKPFSAIDIDVALHEVLTMRRPYLLNALMAKSAVLHIPPSKQARQPKLATEIAASA